MQIESVNVTMAEPKAREIGGNSYTVFIDLEKFDPIWQFEELAHQMGFQMIEKQELYATAVKKKQKSRWTDLLCCMNWWGEMSTIQAVKIVISENVVGTVAQCHIKSLSSNHILAQEFVQKFKKQIHEHNAESKLTSSPKIAGFIQKFPQNNTSPFHLEACAHYMFFRILKNPQGDQRQISQNLEQGVREFFQAFNNVEESSDSIPTPLINVIQLCKQVFSGMVCILNQIGVEKVQKKVILPYLKIAVEKYIFDKTATLLQAIYHYRDQVIEEEFKRKRKIILQSMSASQIFKEVLLSEHLRIESAEEASQQQSMRAQIAFCITACPQLERISSTTNPREKIKECQLMYANLKSFFLEKTSQKHQLSSMEDIIPVLIIVILCCDIPNLRSELSMMLDFINADEQFESEKKLILNLSESYNYIVRDWKI